MPMPKRFLPGAAFDALKKLHFRKPTQSDLRLFVVSFFAAVCLWVFIASTVSSSHTIPIYDVPVTYNTAGTKAEDYGLSLFGADNTLDDLTVDCVISGDRSEIGGLTRRDVEAYVDFDAITDDTVGRQVLPIRLRTTNNAKIKEYTLSQDTVVVSMDEYQSRDIPVSAIYDTLTPADEETVIDEDAVTVEPSTVTVRGPSMLLSDIDRICVTLTDGGVIAQKDIFNTGDFALIDEDGNTVDPAEFTFSATNFAVTVPVSYYRKLPVTVDLSGAPAGFDTEFLLRHIRLNSTYELPDYSDNNLTIEIQTDDFNNKAKLDTLKSYTIGTVPLYALSVDGAAYGATPTLDDGFTDSSNLGKVMVSLDDSDLSTKSFWIKNSDITLQNGSANYQYSLQSPDGNTRITLIGPQEELDEIEADDLRASVNLFNVSISEEGTIPQAFQVTLPETVSRVWVSPLPSVRITVTRAT